MEEEREYRRRGGWSRGDAVRGEGRWVSLFLK
jgi:hypothetical protein